MGSLSIKNHQNIDYSPPPNNYQKDFSTKLKWVDNNMNKKDVLCYTNFSKDLFIQRDIKPITIHKKLKPQKSNLKGSISQEVKRLIENNSNNVLQGVKKEEEGNRRYSNNTSSNPQRSFSHDQRQTNPELGKQQPNIIITPVVSKVVHNNYYYFSPSNVFPQQYNEGENVNLPGIDPMISGNVKPLVNIGYDPNIIKNDRPNSVKGKDNMPNNNPSFKQSQIGYNNSKGLQNNFMNNKSTGMDFQKKEFTNSSQNLPIAKPLIPSGKPNMFQGDIKKSSSTPLISQQTNPLSKSTTIKQGPVKIQEDKQDYNISTVKKMVYQNNYAPKQYGTNITTQMRTGSKPKENIYERPSTAPSKNDIKTSTSTMSSQPISNSSSLKRLPSPNIKSNNSILSENKNPLYSSVKYRSPSPAILLSGKGNLGMSSFKGVPSKKYK